MRTLFLLIFSNLLLFPFTGYAGMYLDFDSFPATIDSPGNTPSDAPGWEYSSGVTNYYPANNESFTSGWKQTSDAEGDGIDWFYRQRFDSCYNHIGVGTYGYFHISENGHSGNALAYTITGGKVAESSDDGSCVSHGTELYNLESYTGPADIYTSGTIGHPYVYFKKLNASLTARNTTPFSAAAGTNRLSFYMWRPAGHVNGIGGSGNPVRQTFQIGIFVRPESTGFHHYFNYLIQGGGWAKIQVEETTNGDNGSDGSTRFIDGLLYNTWQWYWTSVPYAGAQIPPYTYKIDEIEFSTDTYSPQNNETISNIAILYKDDGSGWEVSFNDKYKGAPTSHATYELRYSMAGPITNENWSSATPVEIMEDTRFQIQNRTDGKFQKWWPYYQGMWAPFQLSSSDTTNLSAGTTVHFAIKDVSQFNNTQTPNDGINDRWGVGQGGRPYATDPDFDWATDSLVLNYIKRISYTITGSTTTLTCYLDADGDKYSNGKYEVVETCSANYFTTTQLIAISGDCNDDNANIHPAAPEIPGNGIDEDCSGSDLSQSIQAPHIYIEN